MNTSKVFRKFIKNLAISNTEEISNRYAELTKTLNKYFRNTDSEIANTLQVGSFGRKTGINGISDLDMLYIIPKSSWDNFNTKNGQYKLLSETKKAILERYPCTDVSVDRLVVSVRFTNFYIEVQPVFEQEDGSFKYPDTKNGGKWKITKPREEIDKISSEDKVKNENLRRLCKMARAWKNKHGVAIGGLLIDTLAYNFLKSTKDYDDKSYRYYGQMSRDFFRYLSDLPPEQSEYAALGSNQRVKVKEKFQEEAKKAYELCLDAIEAENQNSVNDKWKKVYGRPFPAAGTSQITMESSLSASYNWENTEEFVEDKFPVDIREYLNIDCEVSQNGFRKCFLREFLMHKKPLKLKRDLLFTIKEITAEEPYQIYWKVLNRGDEAKNRNCIRGQIEKGYKTQKEHTDFKGDHIVECYCVKNGVVVARDRIHVPIVNDGSDYD